MENKTNLTEAINKLMDIENKVIIYSQIVEAIYYRVNASDDFYAICGMLLDKLSNNLYDTVGDIVDVRDMLGRSEKITA